MQSLSSHYASADPADYLTGYLSDPDLAIAKAKASQDHGMHGCDLIDRILILILAKANSTWIDQKSIG